MNEKESNSTGMSPMSEIKSNEKSEECIFCGNKDGIESKIVACVTEVTGNIYADSKKQVSTLENPVVQFDSSEWNIFLCPSCIMENRQKAFLRTSLKWLGAFLAGLAGAVVLIPLLYILWLPGLVHQTAFHTIAEILLILFWVLCIYAIIMSPIMYFKSRKEYQTFKLNISAIKEEDKKIAFIEAGQRILDDLKLSKDASKFRHFSLPKFPKDEDYSKMFPNKFIDIASAEWKIYCDQELLRNRSGFESLL
ncbi:MAG: DUF202 domain-containing protein [Ignavibacteria bacterium]|jgi:hypothetical protein